MVVWHLNPESKGSLVWVFDGLIYAIILAVK
jgi:hypothetical protein